MAFPSQPLTYPQYNKIFKLNAADVEAHGRNFDTQHIKQGSQFNSTSVAIGDRYVLDMLLFRNQKLFKESFFRNKSRSKYYACQRRTLDLMVVELVHYSRKAFLATPYREVGNPAYPLAKYEGQLQRFVAHDILRQDQAKATIAYERWVHIMHYCKKYGDLATSKTIYQALNNPLLIRLVKSDSVCNLTKLAIKRLNVLSTLFAEDGITGLAVIYQGASGRTLIPDTASANTPQMFSAVEYTAAQTHQGQFEAAADGRHMTTMQQQIATIPPVGEQDDLFLDVHTRKSHKILGVRVPLPQLDMLKGRTSMFDSDHHKEHGVARQEACYEPKEKSTVQEVKQEPLEAVAARAAAAKPQPAVRQTEEKDDGATTQQVAIAKAVAAEVANDGMPPRLPPELSFFGGNKPVGDDVAVLSAASVAALSKAPEIPPLPEILPEGLEGWLQQDDDDEDNTTTTSLNTSC